MSDNTRTLRKRINDLDDALAKMGEAVAHVNEMARLVDIEETNTMDSAANVIAELESEVERLRREKRKTEIELDDWKCECGPSVGDFGQVRCMTAKGAGKRARRTERELGAAKVEIERLRRELAEAEDGIVELKTECQKHRQDIEFLDHARNDTARECDAADARTNALAATVEAERERYRLGCRRMAEELAHTWNAVGMLGKRDWTAKKILGANNIVEG